MSIQNQFSEEKSSKFHEKSSEKKMKNSPNKGKKLKNKRNSIFSNQIPKKINQKTTQ